MMVCCLSRKQGSSQCFGTELATVFKIAFLTHAPALVIKKMCLLILSLSICVYLIVCVWLSGRSWYQRFKRRSGGARLDGKVHICFRIPYAGPPRVVIISQKNRHRTRAQNVEKHTMHVLLCCFWSIQVSKSHPRSGFSESLLCLFVSLSNSSFLYSKVPPDVCVHSQNTSCFCPNIAMLGQT